MISLRAALIGKNRVLFGCVVLTSVKLLVLLAFALRGYF